jgi:2-methylfumaryl-CoA isomerase
VTAGYLAVNGLLAAERHRRLTGNGQWVRLALSDTAFATMGNLGFIGEVQVNGEERQAIGNDLYGAFGRDFATKDGGRVMIVAVTKRQWKLLVEATGLGHRFKRIEEELGLDLGDEGDRFLARAEIANCIDPWCADRPLEEIRKIFDSFGVGWGPYRTIRGMLTEDERCSSANPMFEEMEQPGIGTILTPGSPLEFGGAPRLPVCPAPQLGQHTDQILSDVLGLTGREISGMHDRGVVEGP